MCDQCEVLYINGIKCHETGCPDAWRDEIRECKWCGTDFEPEDQDQQFCDESCAAAFYGYPDPTDDQDDQEDEG